MKIMKIFRKKAENISDGPCPCIAFLGDSVTQGCFELVKRVGGGIETVYDRSSAYQTHLDRMFQVLYPHVPVQMIHAGISGNCAHMGLERLEQDVLRYHPDLTVVCFGLNDCGQGPEGLDLYLQSLREIFLRLQAADSEVLFLTPNMMCTYVSPDVPEGEMAEVAEISAQRQNQGVLDLYLNAAKDLCAQLQIKVCDCYAQWQRLVANGVDVTQMLANKINHPSRELNWLFAWELMNSILD